jgi:hypothetical protein
MARLAPETLLIDAMLRDEKIVDRLIAYRPSTAQFRNVLNHEQAARELRLADLARMLDLPIDTLLAVAEGVPPADAPPVIADEGLAPGWVDPGENSRRLDLRPIFERGIEPLAMILEEVSQLGAQAAIVIEAPFHPLPLRRLLAGRGFESYARQISSEHWQIVFRRQSEPAAAGPASRESEREA